MNYLIFLPVVGAGQIRPLFLLRRRTRSVPEGERADSPCRGALRDGRNRPRPGAGDFSRSSTKEQGGEPRKWTELSPRSIFRAITETVGRAAKVDRLFL